MRTSLRTVGAAAAVVALAAAGGGVAAAAPAPSTNDAPVATLLTQGGLSLTGFEIATGTVGTSLKIKGLSGDTRLVGIDYRVQDGKLYGVGDRGNVYRISDNAYATKVKKLTVALSGSVFGVDFNPAANALRIVSDTGQNLRQSFVDLTTATAVDGAINYTAGVTAAGVTGAGYTNNDLDASTGTTLFDIDSALDQVAVQAPANNGSLSVTGKLGVDVTGMAFDVFSSLGATGRTTGNTGYGVAPGEGSTTFATVNLLTGDIASSSMLAVVAYDIAVRLVPQPPA